MQVPGMTVMMSPVSTRNVVKACILLSVLYVCIVDTGNDHTR